MSKSTGDKIRNWIYYYKWYVVIGVLLLIFGIRYITGILGVAGPHPDLQAAFVGRHVLSQETIEGLQAQLADRAGDYNHDGKVLVEVHQYLISDESGTQEAQQSAAAAEVSLVGDIDGCESYLFLLEDPERFQIEWQILADENGNPPATSDYSVDKKVYPVTSLLPGLYNASAEEDREVIESLFIGRRCFYTDKLSENAADLAKMWNAMTGTNGLPAYAGGASAATGGMESADGGSMANVADSESGGADAVAAEDAGMESVETESSAAAVDARNDAPALPAADADGKVRIGRNVLAPHTQGELTLNEYNEALAANGFYYATWTSGDPSEITNSDGEKALLYPLQLYMVTYEGTNSADTESKASGWLAAARQNYQVSNEYTYSAAGREYTVLEYTFSGGNSPYACGISAFLTSESDTAICAELLSADAKQDGRTLQSRLESFLSCVQ